MKVLTYTTLYPNAAQPHHGIFVEQRLRQMRRRVDVPVHVIAPVPWFPSDHPRFGAYAIYARAPKNEERHGIAIEHPRYPVLPSVGMTVAPFLLGGATAGAVRHQQRKGFDFDRIAAHYF